MTLQDRIHGDLKVAMLARDKDKMSLLRVIIGEFSRIDLKDKTDKNLTDEQVIRILKKLAENALQLGNLNEIDILAEYLPKSLSREELTSEIDKIFLVVVAPLNMGTVMKLLKALGIPYDGKMANEIITAKFNDISNTRVTS